MVLLGESAYAFYLWHQPVVNFVGRPDDSLTAFLVTWVVAFTLTVFVAVGSHLALERPVRNVLRRLLAGQPPPPPRAA